MLHYFVIGVCILVIICFQIKIFLRTILKSKQFDNIFPKNAEDDWIVQKKDVVQIVSKGLNEERNRLQQKKDGLKTIKSKLQSVKKNIEKYASYEAEAVRDENIENINKFREALKKEDENKRIYISQEERLVQEISLAENSVKNLEKIENDIGGEKRYVIIASINKYLEKNKDAVVDFNLIRDIIDRNCDSIEEEIHTQIPIPLYFGLMGTMLGILIGVIVLVASGSLGNLLTSFVPPDGIVEGSEEYENAKQVFEETATSGVSALFGGVALAMISSIIGIILTTIGSLRAKNIKVCVEDKKHIFITWLQTELLPKISSDLSSALIKIGHDLNEFNRTFSSNAELLSQTIADVRQANEEQSRLLQLIESLKISKIAKANIEVYDRLSNCTQEIASLSTDLDRIQLSVREVGSFMESSINEYERRNTYIQDASGKVDIAIMEGEENLSNRTRDIYAKYNDLLNILYIQVESTTKNLGLKYDEQVDGLHRAIVEKLTDVKQLENELKNLVSVKTGISNLEKATTEQTKKIDNLANVEKELAETIRVLAQMKVSGVPTSVSMKMPIMYKILIVVASSVVILAGVFYIVQLVLSYRTL